jgi:hypothetical protein
VTEHFKGVEQWGEAFWRVQLKIIPFHGAFWQGQALAALQTGEVMHISRERGIKGFTRGKMTAAHLSLLLQQVQIAVDRG